jgi:hypothetical protein
MMNNRIKAFVEAFKLVQFEGVIIADIRRIGIQYQVDGDLLLQAIASQNSGPAAIILGVDVEDLDNAIELSQNKELN